MRRQVAAILVLTAVVLLLGGCRSVRADLDYMLTILETVHPSLAEGFSDEQQALIDEVGRRLDEPLRPHDYMFALQEILCTLSDAHTTLHPGTEDRFFQLPLIWLADGLYVAEDADSLAAGDRVLLIGERTPPELWEALARHVPAENGYWVMVRGEELLARESWLAQLGVLDPDGGLRVVVARDGEDLEVRLPPADMTLPPAVARRVPVRHWVGWEIEEELSLGVFHLDVCRPDSEYERVLDEFFRAVNEQGVSTLVVDLRYNTGGNSQVLNEFIRYLDIDSYRHVGVLVRYSWPVARQRRSLHAITRTVSGGVDEFPPRVVINERKDPSFDGEVFVLTSPMTFSSGKMFAPVLRDNGLATLVGEPTGGSPNSYGDILIFRLPGTGLRLTVSHKYFTRPEPAAGSETTLHPDILVNTTIDDFLHRGDPQMDAVRELVAGGEGD